MPSEPQFASLDGTAFHAEENVYHPNPANIARRSVSIFSRRGTETPEPKPHFIAQKNVPTNVPTNVLTNVSTNVSKPMSDKQKNWIKRKSLPTSSSNDEKPRGTILNAVPAAKTIKMTALEEEMATSPNEEIISAISGSPIKRMPSNFEPFSPVSPSTSVRQETSPTSQKRNSWSMGSISRQRTKTRSQLQRDADSRVGVWIDGIAHWDGQQSQGRNDNERSGVQNAIGFMPLRRVPTGRLNTPTALKPNLSVIIPGNEPLVNDTTVSTVVNQTSRQMVSIAPPSIVSTPTITVEDVSEISLVDSSSSLRSTTPVEQSPVSIKDNIGESASTTKPPKKSSSSSSISSLEDEISNTSQRSSATSLATLAIASTKDKEKASPEDDSNALFDRSNVRLDLNKPLPPCPIPPLPRREAPAPPSSPTEGQHIRQSSTRSAPGLRRSDGLRIATHRKSTHSLSQLDLADEVFIRSAPGHFDTSTGPSPTLSQAEEDLEAHLSALGESSSSDVENDVHESGSGGAKSVFKSCDDQTGEGQNSDDQINDSRSSDNQEPTTESSEISTSRASSMRRHDSVKSVMHPPERAPTLPKRSRKREWRAKHGAKQPLSKTMSTKRRKSESNAKRPVLIHEDLPMLWRSPSAVEMSTSNPAHLVSIPTPAVTVDDGLVVLQGPVRVNHPIEQEASVSSDSAEDVLLHILASLKSTKDLINTAMINKGMYRVYKENEMDLVRIVCYNQSPAASELREWCQPDDDRETTSLRNYMRSYHNDLIVVERLKSLILNHCHTFIRRETAFALSTPGHPNAQRFDDAFWRIWCFCKIFGYNKGREEDVTGQVDWLRGGLVANNQDLTATMNTNLDYDIGSVLLNAPEFFAKGNNGGLTAQQLYDITEIWTCLGALLEGYHGRTAEAWMQGLFDNCGIGLGDVEMEEQLLEEWTSYLLTLGPAVVLEMAEFALDTSSAGFALAKMNGWTQWTPPEHNGSRHTFLKEPVSRLYEERVTAAAMKFQNPRDQEKKELSRKRVANLAAEIKLARQSSGYKRLPLIDMKTERAMSIHSRRNSTASTNSIRSQSSYASSSGSRRASTPVHRSRTPNFSAPKQRTPPSTSSLWSPRKISPIIEDRVETFNRMSLQNFAAGVAEDTSEIAMRRIIDMGFTAAQAREALRVTDMGDGLRVDRAVDLLLRQRR